MTTIFWVLIGLLIVFAVLLLVDNTILFRMMRRTMEETQKSKYDRYHEKANFEIMRKDFKMLNNQVYGYSALLGTLNQDAAALHEEDDTLHTQLNWVDERLISLEHLLSDVIATDVSHDRIVKNFFNHMERYHDCIKGTPDPDNQVPEEPDKANAEEPETDYKGGYVVGDNLPPGTNSFGLKVVDVHSKYPTNME